MIAWAFHPDLPEFPLPEPLLKKVEALPGHLPTSLPEFIETLTLELQQPTQPAPDAALASPSVTGPSAPTGEVI